MLVTTSRLVLEIARDLRHRKHGFTRAAVQFVRVVLYPVLVHLPVHAGQEQQVELGGLHLSHSGQQAVHGGVGDPSVSADCSRLTVVTPANALTRVRYTPGTVRHVRQCAGHSGHHRPVSTPMSDTVRYPPTHRRHPPSDS